MFSCVSSGRFYSGGALRSPRLCPPLPRSQTCLLPSRGPGRSCLPEARRRRAALSPPPPAGSPAALCCRLKLEILGCSPSLPAVPACPGPGHRRRPPTPRPARSSRSCLNGDQPFSAERIVPSVALHPQSLFEIFRGGARRLPGFQGDSPLSVGGPWSWRAGKAPRLSGGSHGGKNLFNKFTPPAFFFSMCVFGHAEVTGTVLVDFVPENHQFRAPLCRVLPRFISVAHVTNCNVFLRKKKK